MAGEEEIESVFLSPEELVEKALELVPRGNIGIAYTYNEPLVGYEYVADCGRLAREKKLKNVLVTNGYICPGPLTDLLPLIDAMNIDLKSFDMKFYKRIGGKLETVKQTIRLAAASCHVEITFLVIPNENDSADEIKAMSEWISWIDPDIPLHISRFFPMYRYDMRKPTPVSKVYELAEIAKKSLRYVYTGNC
jgi:pyruvate formate lyase activating enzyme